MKQPKRIISKKMRRKLSTKRNYLVMLVAVFALGVVFAALAQQKTQQAQEKAKLKGYGFATSLIDLSDAGLKQRLSDMKATGVTWVRFDLSWNTVQHDSASTYDWTDYDRVTKAASAHGFKTLMIIDFTPPWARRGDCASSEMCAPANPAAFAAFAAAAVHHYKSYGVAAWEVWNEPNIPEHYMPGPNPQAYVSLLKAAYHSIKQADPQATVVMGGVAPSDTQKNRYGPTDFLRSVYAAGGAGSFDAISAHPYTFPNSPSTANPADAWGQLMTMHQLMAAHGDDSKQIWLTEYGAPTNGPNRHGDHVTEAFQAQLTTDAIKTWHSYPWAGPFFWYDYKDADTSTVTSENFFGLVRFDGTPKPALAAFKRAVSEYR